MRFGSDNQTGVDGSIRAALDRAMSEGLGQAAAAYGGDRLTERVSARFSEIFEKDVAVFFVGSGTAANALALSTYARPGGIVFCHDQAHIFTSECGAVEFLSSCRLIGLGGAKGKIDPAALRDALAPYPDRPNSGPALGSEYLGQPMAISVSQINELGAAYAPGEIKELANLAHAKGAIVHMDGARFANALVSLDVAPAELSWRAGADVLSFGASKNGCLAAEAVVFFDKAQAALFPFLRKRSGHLISKHWLIGAQLDAYLREDHWLRLASHANAMARRLAEEIRGTARLAFEPSGNEVFAILPVETIAELQTGGAIFHEWDGNCLPTLERPSKEERLVRLVASFDTREEEVERFFAILAAGKKGARKGRP